MQDLNLSLLIRYGYGGILLFVMLLIQCPHDVQVYVQAAGPVLSPLIILGIGACIYVLYRHLLGEWFLYPLSHFFDWLIFSKICGTSSISPFFYLKSLGIPWWQCRNAYNAIRREFLSSDLQKQLNVAHAEIHILYITAIELLILGFLKSNFVIIGVASCCLIAAWATDIQQHHYELQSITSDKTLDQLKESLRKRGYSVT